MRFSSPDERKVCIPLPSTMDAFSGVECVENCNYVGYRSSNFANIQLWYTKNKVLDRFDSLERRIE